MSNLWLKIKLLFSRDPRLLYTIREFGHVNKDLLIIVCDKKTDRMYATYQDRFVNGKIKSPTGKKTHVVRDVLLHSHFKSTGEGHMNSFIMNLMETLQLPIGKGNEFYKWIDGALFAIAKNLRATGKVKKEKGIVSPFINQKVK